MSELDVHGPADRPFGQTADRMRRADRAGWCRCATSTQQPGWQSPHGTAGHVRLSRAEVVAWLVAIVGLAVFFGPLLVALVALLSVPGAGKTAPPDWLIGLMGLGAAVAAIAGRVAAAKASPREARQAARRR
jgi:hypothetical protein